MASNELKELLRPIYDKFSSDAIAAAVDELALEKEITRALVTYRAKITRADSNAISIHCQ